MYYYTYVYVYCRSCLVLDVYAYVDVQCDHCTESCVSLVRTCIPFIPGRWECIRSNTSIIKMEDTGELLVL